MGGSTNLRHIGMITTSGSLRSFWLKTPQACPIFGEMQSKSMIQKVPLESSNLTGPAKIDKP
jgi:hypothetical protein